jgi:2-polyprenyl-3-methyl-5-hydroxy-6-metoxy-1,4-benzoquinol methylase
VLVKRGVSLLLRYHTHHQWEINTSFAAFMQDLDARLTDQDRMLATLGNDSERNLRAVQTELVESRAETERAIAAVQRLADSVHRFENAFAARPYMADDVYGASGDPEKPMGFGLDSQGNAALTQVKVPEFEDLFRGPREFIAERQSVYLPFFQGMQHVVDLGSGRGEFLDLLREHGIDAVGVDLNEMLVELCRDRGLKVELADGVEYLEHLPEQSLDAIFSAQFIEHVEPSQLAHLLELAYAKLRPNGLFIAETVNPESYQALKTFHVDLTHQHPIYPQVLLHMCQHAKFLSARIFYPLGGGFTQSRYMDAGEYAIVALR